LETDLRSIMGPFLAGAAAVPRDRPARAGRGGQITIEIGDLYNLHDLTAAFPVHRLTALAGPSGAGKSALILDSLIPAARARLSGSALPGHVRRRDLGGRRGRCRRRDSGKVPHSAGGRRPDRSHGDGRAQRPRRQRAPGPGRRWLSWSFLLRGGFRGQVRTGMRQAAKAR